MSWLATKYAWKCRNEKVKGSVRLVLLAIALRVRKHYVTTVPTPIAMLCKLTFLSEDTITRCLDTLAEEGEVRRVRRGVYAMVKMQGPLFACDPPENPQDAGSPPPLVTPQDAGLSGRKMRVSPTPSADVHLSSEVVRTEVPTSSKNPDDSAAVAAFLDWFVAAYPQHRGGVLYRASAAPAKVEAAVRELLVGRTVPRLQAMALVMWADTTEPWLNNPQKLNDRGVFSLRHRATYLEACVIARERRRTDGYAPWCPHQPKCADRDACIERQIAQRQEAVS